MFFHIQKIILLLRKTDWIMNQNKNGVYVAAGCFSQMRLHLVSHRSFIGSLQCAYVLCIVLWKSSSSAQHSHTRNRMLHWLCQRTLRRFIHIHSAWMKWAATARLLPPETAYTQYHSYMHSTCMKYSKQVHLLKTWSHTYRQTWAITANCTTKEWKGEIGRKTKTSTNKQTNTVTMNKGIITVWNQSVGRWTIRFVTKIHISFASLIRDAQTDYT